MIKVTKLNQSTVYVNSELIEFIEETPDTVLTLTNGIKLVVEESAEDVIDRVVEFRRRYMLERPRFLVRGEEDGQR
jgi:flagellar protein FlbD